MKTVADRIRELRRRLQLTQEGLGKFAGVSKSAVSQWERGITEPERDALLAMQRSRGINPEWVAHGKGECLLTGYEQQVVPIEPAARKIPLINYIQAGHPKELIDDYAAGTGMEKVTIYGEVAERCGPYCFALKIEGDSMLPDFKPGDVVIVDPDVPHRPGDIVVAKLDRGETATLKKYRSRGYDDEGREIFELVPLNNDYHTITVSASTPGHIVGTVVEHHRKLR